MTRKRVSLMIAGGLFMFGCGNRVQQIEVKVAAPADLGVAIENVPADVPQFKRIYNAKLDNRASIKITAKTYLGDRMLRGELDQPNGRWVLFDPDEIAEKILDPLLVPLVQKYVDEIKRIDKQFVDSKPSSFTDEAGQVWKRGQS